MFWRKKKKEKKREMPACKRWYKEFLKGYFAKGGKASAMYYYGFSCRNIVLVRRDAKIPAYYGSLSRTFIVLPGVKVDVSDVGHNTVLDLNGYEVRAGSLYLFLDRDFMDVPGYVNEVQRIVLEDLKRTNGDLGLLERYLKIAHEFGLDLSEFVEHIEKYPFVDHKTDAIYRLLKQYGYVREDSYEFCCGEFV